jgi:hypothetical protein
MQAAGADEDRVSRPDLANVAGDLEITGALDDEIDLLAAGVVVPLGRLARRELCLGEALPPSVKVLANRGAVLRDERLGVPFAVPELHRYDWPAAIPATSCAASVGVVPTRTPRASNASFFACAVPEEPEMIAPAWPIVFPCGAVNPAM